jgi:hypothetical protein
VQVLARSYTVAHGCPPRQYTVTFRVGEPRVSVQSGGVRREYEFHGKGYKPGAHAHVAMLIDRFDAATDQPSVERVNEELLAVSRQPAKSRSQEPGIRSHQPDDHQLPVGDRA